MSFPMPKLDDRTYQDIVDGAKRRIPHHTPEWTDHNLSDPGVALIELFAWMTDSIIYQLNRVPDRLYRSFLDLVGVTPYPPQPASTAVTFWVSPTETATRTVPTGTRVATTQAADGSAVEFLTTDQVVIRQPVFTAAQTGREGGDAFDDVKALLDLTGQSMQCFPSREPGEAVFFGFEESLAANVLHIAIETSINGIGVDPDRPPLVWEVSTGPGRWEPAEIDDGGDTTFGLNQTGRVLLYLPFAHSEERYGPHRAYWLRVRLTGDQPAYAEPPTIDRVSFRSLGGRAHAEQGVVIGREELGTANGTPGQWFRTTRQPVLPRGRGETVEVIRPDGFVETWMEVENFSLSEKDDQHFTWDSATGEIRFGPAVSECDGTIRRRGAIPAAGALVVATGYRTGGGRRGNVPADSIVVVRSNLPFIQRANNRKEATGGIDAETVANAKLRGPLSLITGDRAVTAQDFEHLARIHHPQIARARCRDVGSVDVERQATVDTDTEPIHLYVVPKADELKPEEATMADFLPDLDLLEKLAATLDEHRLVGVRVVVGPPEYTAVSIAAHVTADLNHAPIAVRDRCLKALYKYVNPLTGGPEEDGWPWGANLERGAISQLLKSLDGVHTVQEVLFFDADFDERDDFRIPTRSGAGRDRFSLPDFALPVSALHQVVVDEIHSESEAEDPT